MASPYFGKATFDFLADLAAHNDRDWFAAHKADYESAVKEPALRFIQDFTPHLEALSPHFHAGPRSLFRIHRDTRFSNDKRPYKTHTGIHFRHDTDRDVHKPGFYLHIEPEGCFAGLGIWRPDAPTLRAVREHMAE
ncbi:MAG: TIGR02453 family protein, partial [Gemmatimonadota bacterium]|nr:TIGR02453 family protein [Gemmatimonadota bacterium]